MGALILAALLAFAPVQDDDWGPGQAWTVAQQTQDRALRVRALIAALDEVADDPVALHPRLMQAFDAFRGEHDAYAGERALTLALAMHRCARATWSAYCVEGGLRRLGRYAEARDLLAAHLETVRDPAERLDLIQRQALVAAGAGWTFRERAHLGRALALGGSDAYQMLGRLELAQGRPGQARTLFRMLLEQHEDAPAAAPPWALRGWGLALLPPKPEPLGRTPR